MMIKAEVDTRQFSRAMSQYLATTKRDLADATNRIAFDVSRWAIEETKRSDKQAIQSLNKKEWWPKYIAKRIGGRGVGATFTRKGQSRRVHFQGNFTRAQARTVSAKIIAARIRSRAFIASGFISAAKDFASRVFGEKRVPRRGTGGSEKPTGRGIPARPGTKPVAWIVNTALNAFKFSSRPNAMPVAQAALQRALTRKTRDLQEVIRKRLARTAKQFSAR